MFLQPRDLNLSENGSVKGGRKSNRAVKPLLIRTVKMAQDNGYQPPDKRRRTDDGRSNADVNDMDDQFDDDDDFTQDVIEQIDHMVQMSQVENVNNNHKNSDRGPSGYGQPLGGNGKNTGFQKTGIRFEVKTGSNDWQEKWIQILYSIWH